MTMPISSSAKTGLVSSASDALGDGPVQERPCEFAGGEDWQSAHHGNQRRAEKYQRGRDHHEQHVLQHVGGQHEAVEDVHR